jgi:hypothetical protein
MRNFARLEYNKLPPLYVRIGLEIIHESAESDSLNIQLSF